MNKNYLFIILLASFLSGCNFFSSHNTNKRIEEGFDQLKEQMMVDCEKTKDTFNLRYQEIFAKTTDERKSKKLIQLYSASLNILDYLDSIIIGMKSLEKSNLKEVEGTNSFLIENGTADSIYQKLGSLYMIFDSLAVSKTVKSELKSQYLNLSNDPETNITRNLFFDQKTTWQVIVTLYALQIEILGSSMIVLNDYK